MDGVAGNGQREWGGGRLGKRWVVSDEVYMMWGTCTGEGRTGVRGVQVGQGDSRFWFRVDNPVSLTSVIGCRGARVPRRGLALCPATTCN